MAKSRQYFFEGVIKALLPEGPARYIDHRIKLALADAVMISFPRSGRTWLRAVLTHYFARLYDTPRDPLIDFANLHNRDSRVPRLYFSHEADYRGGPDTARVDRQQLRRKKLVFQVHNPPDVIFSHYSHRVERDLDFDGPLGSLIAAEEGTVTSVLDYNRNWSAFLAEHGRALLLRYEDLQADPAGTLAALLRYLGQPVDEAALKAAVEETQVDALVPLR